MPASKLNYIMGHKGDSQVYGSAKKEIALATPLPPGQKIENRWVLFIAFDPDNETLCVYPLSKEEIQDAELAVPKKKETDNE